MRVLIFFFLAAVALAQTGATTGALQGVVVDSSGAPIPGVDISLKQVSSGVVRNVQTGEGGQFTASSLPIGDYTFSARKAGLNPVSVESISISVGQTARQRIVMSPASVTERLEVQEQADSLQTSATTANVALGGDRIEEAPAPNRNYLNFVLAAPGVASSSGSNASRSAAGLRNVNNDSGFVFAGMRGRNNSISIDGVDNRDETTGGNRVAIGLEMIQEFRVSGTSVGAEFGGAAGGLVNVVTHGGENVWHGDFTFFGQNELLNARNAEVELPGRPRARRYQPGFSVGGPIHRDKTFFFTAVEQSLESADEWSEAPPRDTALLNQLLRQPAYSGIGARSLLSGLFGSGERDTEVSFKLSHLLTPTHTLSARYAFSRGSVRNDVQSLDNFTDVSARGSSLIQDHSLVAGWTAVYGPTRLNDFRIQLSRREADLTPNSQGPLIQIPGVISFGESDRLDQSRAENHVEAIESFQLVKGNHLLSLGVSAHGIYFDGKLANRFHGVYIFPSLADFIAGQPDIFLQAFGNPHTSINTTPVGFWLQDRCQIVHGLTLEAGVRYDRQWLPPGIPETNRNVAPRLGLAWHPGGNSPWVFRIGAGLFYDRYPLAYLNDALQLNGVQASLQYLAGPLAAQAFAISHGGPLAAPLSGAALSTYRAAPLFLSTYSKKLAIGVERKLDADTTLTVEYSDVTGIHLPRTRNQALTVPPQYDLEQTARSKYHGATVTLNRRLRKELTYLASYSWSETFDDASDYDEQPLYPQNLRADWSLSRQHQRHRVAMSGLFDLPAEEVSFAPKWIKDALEDISLAPVFRYGSGRPVNALLTTDVYRTGAYPLSARPAGVGRNAYLGPQTIALDMRVMKTIKVKEGRARLQFGAEAFNLLNHSNALRVSPYATAGFLQPTEIQNPRQVQLMIQFEY